MIRSAPLSRATGAAANAMLIKPNFAYRASLTKSDD